MVLCVPLGTRLQGLLESLKSWFLGFLVFLGGHQYGAEFRFI
jgi:hypothetical protein